MNRFKTKYGYFSNARREYVITRPDTPVPWTNVVANPDYGFVISQAGGGYSWRTHASLNRITRWEQDLVQDNWGKFIYIRDNADGVHWSATFKPVCKKPAQYECRHGIGYSVITQKINSIVSQLTLFVPGDEPVELWMLTLKNKSKRGRDLSLFSYLEWCLGTALDIHREFHRGFIETEFDKNNNAIYATKRLWTVENSEGQRWNRDWEYAAFHGCNIRCSSFDTDKEAFIGRGRGLGNPKAVETGRLTRIQGKWSDSVASLKVNVKLDPGQEKTIVFCLGATTTKAQALKLVQKYKSLDAVKSSLQEVKDYWEESFSALEVKTPDAAFDMMNNVWLRYQTISCRLWGRTSYFQPGGAFGFRDQLQDSQVFLTINPDLAKKQILLHAAHQFRDGTVEHWWHPLTEEGLATGMTDDLLWLPFITVNYLKETKDFSILKEKVKYLDAAIPAPLFEHCQKAIDKVLDRFSRRGLPLIGEGDWNDGLNCVGGKGKGESVWLGSFLYGILNEWVEMVTRYQTQMPGQRTALDEKIKVYKSRARKLKQAINKYGWDGKWYIRATKDNGEALGSSKNREGRIFLNPQTWSIINKVAPPERVKIVLPMMEKYLYRKYGPILLYPAYSLVDKEIGYLTRYAPGVRENGGLYTHAAAWAVMAECILKRKEEAWKLYKAMCPMYRGLKPDLYKTEPYVAAGTVEGPDSKNFGRGGWSWYTGSSGWMYKVGTEWILGVRPTYEGLIIDPCIPERWKRFKMRRLFRGCVYEIKARNPEGVFNGVVQLKVDGKLQKTNIISACNCKNKSSHRVEVLLGNIGGSQ